MLCSLVSSKSRQQQREQHVAGLVVVFKYNSGFVQATLTLISQMLSEYIR